MQLLVLLLSFFLHPRIRAEEIIGGHEAKPHSHPYMAYLEFWYKKFVRHCGGFLIHEKFVLTAAHCLKSPGYSQLLDTIILLGAHNIKKQEKTQQLIRVKRHIPHPQYNPWKVTNDIMLLQLEEKAHLTREVQLLRLPKGKSEVKPGAVCQVAGWGRLAKGRHTDTLQEVEMTVQKDEECETRFRYYNAATEVCVGDPKIKKDSSKGDSGGPLVCNKVAQGIVSYGRVNGRAPGIYTKLSSYLDWINKTIQPGVVDYSCNPITQEEH
ncbi:granzyme B-like [Octodon degus]|uniref:Granzyme B-like n=1 Tax=Octodon degus TaxID=10160 RepID=A0A6P3FJH3_OCTDE|nr:granzyme B-like [Octodon degus]